MNGGCYFPQMADVLFLNHRSVQYNTEQYRYLSKHANVTN